MFKFTKSNWAKLALFLSVISVLVIGFPNRKLIESQAQTIMPQVPEVLSTDVQVVAPEAIPANSIQVTSTPTINGSSLKIPTIGVYIPLGKTGLDSAGHLMVPANPKNAAWYRSGPKPGDSGTALITGHLDSAAGPGVFINLRKLAAGDEIQVTRDDGAITTFRVDKLASYAQDSTFPWNLVYSTSGPAALRIITCDGVYNSRTGHYSRNLVVYASLVSLQRN